MVHSYRHLPRKELERLEFAVHESVSGEWVWSPRILWHTTVDFISSVH